MVDVKEGGLKIGPFIFGGKMVLTNYMVRWFLIRSRWFNLFINRILRSDKDRDLHDHPWWFLSFILWNGYLETRVQTVKTTTGQFVLERMPKRVRPFTVVFRRAKDLHRLELHKPAVTLVLTGPSVRKWGFRTRYGWVEADKYAAAKTRGYLLKSDADPEVRGDPSVDAAGFSLFVYLPKSGSKETRLHGGFTSLDWAVAEAKTIVQTDETLLYGVIHIRRNSDNRLAASVYFNQPTIFWPKEPNEPDSTDRVKG